MNFGLLEESLGVKFRDRSLLKQALTHKSYLNENRTWPLGHNERLEFIGDAVLELITTEYLFKKFPRENEGVMTQYRAYLVQNATLSELAVRLGLDKYLLLSRGEAKDTGRARAYILSCTYEAIVGAIYLDQGYEAAKRTVDAHILVHCDVLIEKGARRDSKSKLQQLVQEKLRVTPTYELLEERGLDHEKHFIVGVYFGSDLIAKGQGVSKRRAEEDAANAALMLQE